MTDAFTQIFGGGSQQQSSTPINMNPFTNSLYPQVNALASNLAANGIQKYNGPLYSPMGGNESDMLSQLMQMQSQGGGAPGTNDYLKNVLSGNYMPGKDNPFLKDYITAAQRGTMNNLTETLSRTLPGYFTANGQMISPNDKGRGGSSAFDTAAALATQSAGKEMGDIATTMSGQAYDQERNRQQQAVGLSQQEVQNALGILQAQSLPRMIQELGIERGLALYQTNTTQLLQLLQTLGGLAAPVVASQGQASGSNTPGALAGGTNLLKAGAPLGVA